MMLRILAWEHFLCKTIWNAEEEEEDARPIESFF
jgi:hypothetical protein